jgi:DNA-binding transcriptional regulator YiaG
MRLEDLILRDQNGNTYRIIKEAAPNSEVENSIGSWIESQRNQLGLTQAQLATASGIHQGNLSAYEKGRRIPREETIVHLRQVFVDLMRND